MRRMALALSFIAATGAAAEASGPRLSNRAEEMIHQALPVCAGETKITVDALQHKLPENLTGEVIRIDSPRQVCAGQWIAVVSREGDIFLGVPWFLDDTSGTIEARLKDFAWKNLQQNIDSIIDPQRTQDGLLKVTMLQTTERGKIPLQGEVDPAGTVLFIGHFHPLSADLTESRLRVFQPFIDGSPMRGAAKPEVTVIEFSDFECPSCQRAAGYMKPILEKYGDHVRYVRYDLPLLTLHPWAFPAAVAGRAIYRQKPEAFWEFKEQVYASQESLSIFTFDEFAKGFAKDHDLDLKRYEADLASPDLQKTILDGVGTAFSNDVRATPTYMVNGVFIDPGDNGTALESYVAGLLKKDVKPPATPGREKTSTSGR